MSNPLYSYHTFLYPFSYDCKEEKFLESNNWKRDFMPTEVKQDRNFKEQDILLYNEYQYFFPKARKNLFNFREEENQAISRHYYFEKLDKEKVNTFHIQDQCKDYFLTLNQIRLSLYPKFGIGILTFETEYYSGKGSKTFQEVLEINQLGRRLFPPCLVKNEDGLELKSILTADKIKVSIAGNGGEYEIDFNGSGKEYKMEPGMEFIREILGIGGCGDDTRIESILDDRMFVACLIRDDRISETPFVKQIQEEIHGKEAEEVYQFVFIDGANEYSCQSQRMLEEELRNHIYDRWANWGTFHGITEYSLVCATGESEAVESSVVNPFLTSYVDMAKLALVQRAAIVKIESRILEAANSNLKGDVDKERLKKIQDIWRKYVLFQNELFLPEVTFQRQGVEIYQILKDALKVDVMNKHLGEQLDHLNHVAELDYEYLERESDEKLNNIVNFMTVAGLTIASISMSQDFFFGVQSIDKGFRSTCMNVGILGGTTILLLLVSVYLSCGMEKKPGKKVKIKSIRIVLSILVILIYGFFCLAILYNSL